MKRLDTQADDHSPILAVTSQLERPEAGHNANITQTDVNPMKRHSKSRGRTVN